MASRRRNILIDDELWAAAVRAAAQQALDSGKRVTVSDLVRQAILREVETKPKRSKR